MATSTKKSEQDTEKTAGTDASKTQQTTKQAEEREAEQVTEPTKVEKSDPEAAASGSTVGGVVDGDTGTLDDEDNTPVTDAVEKSIEEGAVGTVMERDYFGDDYEVPYTNLVATDLARTSDSDDPAKSWTAQEVSEDRKDEDGNDLDPVALVDVAGTPGQTFRARELPNREVAEKAGIDYDQWVAGLPVRLEVEDEAPRRGIPA